MVTTRPPKTIVKPTALGPVVNTDTKLLIYGLFQKGRVLAQDAVRIFGHDGKRVPRKLGFETETENEALPHLLRACSTTSRQLRNVSSGPALVGSGGPTHRDPILLMVFISANGLRRLALTAGR